MSCQLGGDSVGAEPDHEPEWCVRPHALHSHRQRAFPFLLELIADKWAAIVVYARARGTCRFGELRRDIGGISQKVLADALRQLARDGLLTRTVYPEVPPRVEYALTPLGQTLTEPLGAICKWAEEHLAEVEATRARSQQGDG